MWGRSPAGVQVVGGQCPPRGIACCCFLTPSPPLPQLRKTLEDELWREMHNYTNDKLAKEAMDELQKQVRSRRPRGGRDCCPLLPAPSPYPGLESRTPGLVDPSSLLLAVHVLRGQQLHGLGDHPRVQGEPDCPAVLLPDQCHSQVQRAPHLCHHLHRGECHGVGAALPRAGDTLVWASGQGSEPGLGVPTGSMSAVLHPPQGCLKTMEAWMKKHIVVVAAVALGIAFFEVTRGDGGYWGRGRGGALGHP